MAYNSWNALQSQPPGELDQLLASLGQSTPETNAMAAEQNPAPGMNAPMASPPQNQGSVFNLGNKNQLPPEINYGNQIQNLLGQLKNSENKNAKQQQQSLADYQNQIRQVNSAPTGMDLTPLLALADAWKKGGGNLAASYKAPMSPQEKQQLGLKLQDELLKRTQDMTKDERDQLKDRLNMTLGIAKLSKDTSFNNQIRMQEANANHLQTAQKGLNATVEKDLQPKLQEVQLARSQANDALTNPASAQSLALTLTRLMVPSRVTEVEINRLGGSERIADKLKQIIQSATTGGITPENAQYMNGLIDVVDKATQKSKFEAEQHHANQYAKLVGGSVSPENAWQLVTGNTPEAYAARRADFGDKTNNPEQKTINGVSYVKVPGGWKKAAQ